MLQLFLFAVLELLRNKQISPTLRQIETNVKLRQIYSLNLRRATVYSSITEHALELNFRCHIIQINLLSVNIHNIVNNKALKGIHFSYYKGIYIVY